MSVSPLGAALQGSVSFHVGDPVATCRQTEWHTLVVGLLSALASGIIYSYSTYSNALQAAFSLAEADKEIIGLAPVLCNLITFTTGLILDRTSYAFCLALSSFIMICSYGLYGAIAMKHIHVNNPVHLFFFLGAAGNYGGSFLVATTFTTLPKNFKEERSAVVSMAKSWAGVSSGVATAMFVALFPSSDTDPKRLQFLYFLALLTGIIPLLVLPMLHPLPTEHMSSHPQLAVPYRWRLPLGFAISTALIVATLVATLLHGILAVVMLLLLILAPWILVVPKCPTHELQTIEEASQSETSSRELSRSSPWEGGPLDMMKRLDFYLLWCCTLLIQAGGLFLTTNLGSMVMSRSGASVTAASATSVFSCSQGFARLFTGVASNWVVSRGFPRTCCFAVLCALQAVGHALLTLEGPAPLYAGTAISGWSFGSVYPLLVLTIAEMFGTSRLASNYMVYDGTPGAIGTLFFAQFLSTSVYNAHAGSDGKCHGNACFTLSHVVILSAEILGVLLASVLAFRSRVVYRALSGSAL